MNTAEALIIAVARLEDLLKNDDSQAWKEATKAMPQLHRAVARVAATPAPAPAVPQGEAVAWKYELAVRIDADGRGSGWCWHLTDYKPSVPDGMIRNLRPLAYADAAHAVPQGEPVACLVRHRRLRTPRRLAHDGQDHFSEWSDWRPETLKYGKAVTDPIRNSGPECLFEMQPLYATPTPPANEQAVPSGEVVSWMVYGNYTRQPFGMLCSAEAYMRGLLQSDPDGGYHIRPLRYAAPASAPAQEVGLTDEGRQQVFIAAERRMVREPNLSWRDAIVDEVIAALRAKGQA